MRSQFPVRSSHRRHRRRREWTNQRSLAKTERSAAKVRIAAVQETQSWTGRDAIAPDGARHAAGGKQDCQQQAGFEGGGQVVSEFIGRSRCAQFNVPAIPSSTEAVEVTGESPTLQAEVSSEVKQNGARAVEKAKPASQAQTSQSQRAFAATAGAVPHRAGAWCQWRNWHRLPAQLVRAMSPG